MLPVLLGNLRPLVIGQHALAVERIWDQMYRSNRHSRAGHYMMAISAIDNALWDLRGRVFGAPVFRLLGGPTQMPVPRVRQLPRLLDRSAAGREARRRSSRRTASSARSGSWATAPATARAAWISTCSW